MNAMLLDGIRDSYGRVTYTNKTHEKEIERLSATINRYRWARLALVAITAGGAVGALFTDARLVAIVGGLFSTFSLGITLYGFSFNPERDAMEHRQCARRLWEIREHYLNLIADYQSGRLTDDEAARERDSLAHRLATIYQGAPCTTSAAYAKAQQALKVDEEMTFTDAEIDHLLPPGLRKAPQGDEAGQNP